MPDMYGYMHEVGQAMIDEEVRATARIAAWHKEHPRVESVGSIEDGEITLIEGAELKDMMRERRCDRILRHDGRVR